MTTDDQRQVIAFLFTPEAYGCSTLPIERIDTHIGVVWLAGERAYKLTRAVRFDYANFSTLALRRSACEGEVRLDRQSAGGHYTHVLDEAIDIRHEDATGEAWLHGRFTYMMYRRPSKTQ